jgi:hypothetical protein
VLSFCGNLPDMKRIVALSIASGLCLVGTAVPAQASAGPRIYSSCAAMHKDFKHGIRTTHGHDKTRSGHGGVPDRFIPVHPIIYRNNPARDRDKDGVACEA